MDEVKDRAKQVIKYIVKSHLIKSSLSIFIIVALVIIFLAAIIKHVKLEAGKYEEGSNTNVPYVVSQNINNNVTFGENGIIFEKSAQEIWDELVKNNSVIVNYLSNANELQKLMNAEVVTKYPKIGVGPDKIDGRIEFKRHKTDGTECLLKYIDMTTFDSYVNAQNIEVLNYFTLDQNCQLKIAYIEENLYELTTNDEGIDISNYTSNLDVGNKINNNQYSKKISSIKTKTCDYKNLVPQDVTMPFQYLWSILVLTEDKDFVFELADLVQNTEITIAVLDSIQENKTTDTYTYKKEIRTDIYAKVQPINNFGVTGYQTERYWEDENEDNVDKSMYPASYTKDDQEYNVTSIESIQTNTIDFDLEYANAWTRKISKEFTLQASQNQQTETNSSNIEDTSFKEYKMNETSDNNPALLNNANAVAFAKEVKTYIEKKRTTGNEDVVVNVVYVRNNSFIRSIDGVHENYSETKNSKYVAGTPNIEEKVQKNSQEPNFVSILCKSEYSGTKFILTQDAPDWLFELLENNPDTKNMVDLTKYLLNKASGIDFGVTSMDFSIFTNTSFSSVNVSAGDQLKRFIHYYEHSDPIPTNQDGTKYLIEDDGEGHPTVGYGVDINAHRAIFEASGYPTRIGEYVDIEFVDNLEDMEISEKLEYINSTFSGLNLKPYQVYAMVSRAYNCGNAGATKARNGGLNFEQAYQAYWKEDDDFFKQKNPNANFQHSLYTQLMASPVTSEGKYMAGLEKRRKSEWILFQTGYFDVLNEWYMSNDIISIAKNIHEYMEQNNYTYCVIGTNEYEECGKYNKSHGLDKTFEESKTGHKNSCCATYVSWVLQEAGYLSDSEHRDGANSLIALLQEKGWKKIDNVADLVAGDILCYNGHVEIYAGNNKIYNAGSGSAIRGASPANVWEKFNYALRAPN